MGQRQLRRQRFFAEHPLCCFCGGSAPATTEDHVPARSLFDKRDWPEDYAFPACLPCNGITADDEKIVAMLSRLRHPHDKTTEVQRRETRAAMAAVQQAFPQAFESMLLSANEVRKFLRYSQRTKPSGVSLSNIPVVSIGHPLFVRALKNFSTKLFCALHYKHAGRILPTRGVIAAQLFSNAQIMAGKLPPMVTR